MAETIAQEVRKQFNFLKFKVRKGEDNTLVYLSGTINKRTRMYKEISRYETYANIDYELGIISKKEYDIEIKAIRLFEQSLANYKLNQ